MSYANQDFWPAMGGTEKDLTTYVVQFNGNGTTADPSESTFLGGHIRDITQVSAGVYDIDFTSRELMFKVIRADASVLAASATGDAIGVAMHVQVYVDETLAAGTRVRLVTSFLNALATPASVPADRRVQVALLVMRDRPIYRYT